MVFEELLPSFGKRKIYAVLLGILYVAIAYGTGRIFFNQNFSLVMVFLATLLLIPSTAKLLAVEERIERREGLHRFFRNHGVLMEIFLFLFIGIFIGYLLIGTYDTASISYQMQFLEERGATGISTAPIDKTTQFLNITFNNVTVIVIAFILSLFYGAGALFLIVLNASIFAGFVLRISDLVVQQTAMNAAVFSVHFIPEVFGFLLAAMAGGVISKALVRERIGTSPFQNVVKDGTMLLLLSIACILFAAFLEAFLTPYLL